VDDRITIRKKPDEIYRKLNSFGISEDILAKLEEKRVEKINIIFERSDGTESLAKTWKGEWWTLGERVKEGDNEWQRHRTLKELGLVVEEGG